MAQVGAAPESNNLALTPVSDFEAWIPAFAGMTTEW